MWWSSLWRSFEVFSVIVYMRTQVQRDSIIPVDILSGSSLVSHAPARLSGFFIPILQSTNRLWLATAGTARLRTRIRARLHENCATNRNRPAAFSPPQGEGQAQPGYKFRQLSVMQACYLKPSETRPSRDGYYGCHSDEDRLSVGWQ